MVKKFGILGFAFKANTNDTRESAAIKICNDLLEEGSILFIHDPKVDPKQIEKDLNRKQFDLKGRKFDEFDKFALEGNWIFANEIISAVVDADAICVLTEWEEYAKLDWGLISQKNEKTCLDF